MNGEGHDRNTKGLVFGIFSFSRKSYLTPTAKFFEKKEKDLQLVGFHAYFVSFYSVPVYMFRYLHNVNRYQCKKELISSDFVGR